MRKEGCILKKLRTFLITITFVLSISILIGCSSPNMIRVYTRDTTSGTRDGFFQALHFQEAASNNSMLRRNFVEVAGNGAMINAIRNDRYGIGYITLGSLASSGLRGLSMNGVAPTEENVINGSYRLTRNFNFIVRNEFNSEREALLIDAFLAFLTTKDAKITIINNDGIVEINDDDPIWRDIRHNHPISFQDNSDITIRFGGSTAVERVARALSAEFRTKSGGFIAEHNHVGSSDAFRATQGSERNGFNQLHVGFASRDFNHSEVGAAGTSGLLCVEAIVTVVNIRNTITDINAHQLKEIFSRDGSIQRWSDL